MTYRLLYDIAGAAEMLSTSEQRIDELRTAGDLASVLDGDIRKFKHEDLRSYAESLPSAADLKGPGKPAQPPSPTHRDASQSESPWRTAKAAAKYAAVSEWTIRQAVKDGELQAQAVRTGRGYRLDLAEVDEWMRSRSWEPR